MSLHRVLISAVVVGALAACGPEVPNHTHPEPQPPPPPPAKLAAKIESFSLSPTAIRKGEKAKLTWATSDALSVAVKERSGKGVSGVDSSTLSGEIEVEPSETTTYVLHAVGEGGNAFAIAQLRVADDALEIPEAPLLLSAVPDQIVAGQKTALVWSGPEPVVITDDKNNTVATGNAVSGSVEINPLESTTYTAKSGKQEVSIEVKVKPVINRFFATPAGASAGQTITLHWLTAGATEVKLSERNRSNLFTAPANLRNEGSFEDTIPDNLPNGTVLEYALTVQNGDGISIQTLSLTVSVVPTITRFESDIQIATKGSTDTATISWNTSNAARLSILAGPTGSTPDQLVFVAPSSSVSSGTFKVALPADSTDFEMIVEASQGGQTSQKITIEMVDAPAIPEFEINPPVISAPGEPITAIWRTTGGTSLHISPVGRSSVIATDTDVATGTGTFTATATGEYELVVFNKAGDSTTARKTVTVTNPMGFNISPNPAVGGSKVSLSWDFPNAVRVLGAPVGETAVGPEPFIDLSTSANAQELTELTGATGPAGQRFHFPDGFKFSHFGTSYGAAWITNRGWIGFKEDQDYFGWLRFDDNADNYIAAWAGETLTGGKVYWEMMGSIPERQLVIHWHDWKTSVSGSNLSFEMVLHETGQIDFIYDEMVGASTDWSSVANTVPPYLWVGIDNQDGSAELKSTMTSPPAPAPGAPHAVIFNGASDKTVPALEVAVAQNSDFTLVVDTGTAKLPVSASVTVVPQGSLEITEVMYKPVAGATAGQWIELHNAGLSDLQADIFELRTKAGTTRLPAFTIPRDAWVIVGVTKNTAENGDTPVDLELPGLVLDPVSDTIELMLGPTAIASITYDDTVKSVQPGVSIASGTGAFNGDALCASTDPYGTAGSLGSPGILGGSCAEYTVSPIPSNFVNIFSTGTALMTQDWWVRQKLVFPAQFKFPFDGADRTEVMVGNGYLNFDTSLSNTVLDPFRSPPTAFPSTEAKGLGGIIAPFWDESGQQTNGTYGYFYQYVDPDSDPVTRNGYLIIQWHNVNLLGMDSPTGSLNFQVWLYENGSIDFQYAAMVPGGGSGATADREKGARAVVGVSNISGTIGIVVGNREPIVAPNSGYRLVKN